MATTTMTKTVVRGGDEVALLQPGEVLHYDYRDTTTTMAHKRQAAAALYDGSSSRGGSCRPLRVLQWNIERGVQIEGLVRTMRACAADVYILQELDIGCRRSGYANVPQLLAQALEAEVYFVCEFVEYDSATRPPDTCVGPLSPPFCVGRNSRSPARADTPLPPVMPCTNNDNKAAPLRHLHGNAILSCRSTMHDPVVLPHSAQIDWQVMGPRLREPRHGMRAALRVTLYTNDDNNNNTTTPSPVSCPPLYVYCCHLEPFCGVLTRLRQLGDCMHDAQQLLQRATREQRRTTTTTLQQQHQQQHHNHKGDDEDVALVLPAFIIAGDLNTFAHSIARLSRICATDRMRLLSLGETEACWLQRKVLSRGMAALADATRCCPFSPRFARRVLSWLHAALCNNAFVWRHVYGFTDDERARIDNTALCLYDPGDKATSVTLDLPAYNGWVCGKLDWVLLSNLLVQPLQRNGDGMLAMDVDELVASGAVASPTSIAALQRTRAEATAYDNNNNDDDERDGATHVPPDGYVLINENYRDSDHRGLLLTVRQHRGVPAEAYPLHGGVYTSSTSAKAALLLTRVLPPALLLGTAAVWLQRCRARRGSSGSVA